MKTSTFSKSAVSLLGATSLLLSAGCSTVSGEKSADELATTGPSVVSVRTVPETIELNQQLQPIQPAQVLADIKDFTADITEVKLRFVRVPIEVPMEFAGGTTWKGTLTPSQLKTLAISGETVNYQANVIARNAKGRVAMNQEPVQVAIKAPEAVPSTG